MVCGVVDEDGDLQQIRITDTGRGGQLRRLLIGKSTAYMAAARYLSRRSLSQRENRMASDSEISPTCILGRLVLVKSVLKSGHSP